MNFVPFHWKEQVEPVHFGATTFLLTLRPGDRHLQTSRALSNLIYHAPVHLAEEIDLVLSFFFFQPQRPKNPVGILSNMEKRK